MVLKAVGSTAPDDADDAFTRGRGRRRRRRAVRTRWRY